MVFQVENSMSGDIVFMLFRTHGYPYMYDRNTNAFVIPAEDEFLELSQVKRGELSPELSPVVKKFQQYGLLKYNVVEKIEHYGSTRVRQYLNTRVKQLTLQVTQQCNLRCGYCVYGGKYRGHRAHSNLRMSLKTAKRAIDFFLARNRELSELFISFYGGEPLLEFELIKECVKYANSRVEGKRIRYNMTTNGTLLSDDISDYLVENDVRISISLDGSRHEHDGNRKFANGEGSFDTIISNINRIRDRHPEYARSISIMTTVNPKAELDCVLEYFSTDEVFSDRNIIFNTMSEKNYEGAIEYNSTFHMIRVYEYIKMLFSLVYKLESEYVSPLVGRAKESLSRKQRDVANRAQLATTMHHGGPCLAGVMRLFVRTDGVLFPCERVGEQLNFFSIGTLDGGFDLTKILRIMNIGTLTESECKSCWGLRHCMLCASQLDFSDVPTSEDKVRECPSCLNAAISELHELCVLSEFGYDAEGMVVR